MGKFIKRCEILAIVILLLFIILPRVNVARFFNRIGITESSKNNEKYIENVRSSMLEGKQEVTIRYFGDSNNEGIEAFVGNAIDAALNIDAADTSSDFDYLKNKFKSMRAGIKGLASIYSVSYHFDYHESKEQTAMVESEVERILNRLNIAAMTDYNKIKTIHDYIINNASYDQTYTHYSAYENLINKSSVCQGYAGLTYKMMTEAGIPCRIITGKSANDNHAWNIVQLNGLWYNLDCTWDDPVTSNGTQIVSYEYFLKSEYDFPDHTRDDEYNTYEFKRDHEMASSSYK